MAQKKKKLRSETEKAQSMALFQAVKWANRSSLGCKIKRNKSDKYYDYADRRWCNLHDPTPNLSGTAKDGRAIYIHYIVAKSQRATPSIAKKKFMQEMEELGCIVGVAYSYGDVWDIIQDEKRNPRTFNYRDDEYAEAKKITIPTALSRKYFRERNARLKFATITSHEDIGNEDAGNKPGTGAGGDSSGSSGDEGFDGSVPGAGPGEVKGKS